MLQLVRPFVKIAHFLRGLQGWRANGAALLLGACFTLAFPPFWLLPLAVMAFSGWIWLSQGAATRKRAFTIGWWFGFGHHTTGLYWICIALGIDGGAYWWLMPFALCVLPAYLALFTGAVGAVCFRLRRTPLAQVMLFALAWLLAEYIRAHAFYGFPWNLAGYIWTLSDITLQPAALVGIYGLSLWAVLFCASFSLLAPYNVKQQEEAGEGFALVMLASSGLILWGAIQLSQAAQVMAPAPDIKLRLVQANVEQSLKWNPEHQLETLQRHINLSQRMAVDGRAPDFIIWPETAMPFQIEEGSRWAKVLAAVAPANGALVTGVVRTQGHGDSWQVWNSLRAINEQGQITASYDKAILVPFGEFVPLRSLLSFLPIDKVTQGATDFSSGTGAHALTLRRHVGDGEEFESIFQPVICYETIFPGYRPDRKAPPAHWLLNVTNDAWFGNSSGPYQHLHMARTRAVERGIPMVRVANTGVSAVFDAFGREVAVAPLNTEAVLDVMLPAAKSVPAWYSRHGEFTLVIVCYIMLMFAFRSRIERA